MSLMVCDLVPDWMLDGRYEDDLKYKEANMEFIAAARTEHELLEKALRLAIIKMNEAYYQGSLEMIRHTLKEITTLFSTADVPLEEEKNLHS